MTAQAHIETARLTLRPLALSDAQSITDLISDFDVSKWLSSVPHPYTLTDATTFLEEFQGEKEQCWAIEAKAGFCGVISIGGELGYWIGRPFWGHGYMTEAGDAVIDAWFNGSQTSDICSAYFTDNTRSGNTLRKLGFVDDGLKTTFSLSRKMDVQNRRMRLTQQRLQARRHFRIETDRLIIRELRDDDWKRLQTLGGDPDVARMLFAVTAPWPKDDVKLWLEASKFRGRPGFRPAVCLKNGTLIGTLGFGKSPGATEQTCGYFIGKDYWGQGYATEAMQAFLTDCYTRFDVDVIEADHFTDNPASGHVLTKLGFAKTGTGLGHSAARLEPSPNIAYRLTKAAFQAKTGAAL